MEKYALVSVTDKSGLANFAKGLSQHGYKILSTGGTAAYLAEAGVESIQISAWTGSEEILGGRVKTLHPKVHAGILYERDDREHCELMNSHGIGSIDIVCVNLYDFAGKGVELNARDAVHHIDIGGPTMLRGAAKNYMHCLPVIDPNDYHEVLARIAAGELSEDYRARMASKVFYAISQYDQMIADHLGGGSSKPLNIQLPLAATLRYGENPHQKASFYSRDYLAFKLLQGKELSYNNLLDLDAAFSLAQEFPEYKACVIVKHTNPCGVALGTHEPLAAVFLRAFAADSQSAFGGIVALNGVVGQEEARELASPFLECVIAPKFSPEALEILAAKPNLRLVEVPFSAYGDGRVYRSALGGVLVQDIDQGEFRDQWRTPTTLSANDDAMENLAFAMKVAKHVKSNAIVFAKDRTTVAVGAGQMSRIDSARIAASKAGPGALQGAVMASDGFFPFRDTVDFVGAEGIRAIIQPGGSMRDQESIDACNEQGIAMVLTGSRHFRH